MNSSACAARAAAWISCARRVGLAVGDVGRHGVVEEHRLLRDHAQVRAQRRERQLADVAPVEQHAARRGVVEPRQQVRHGGLAGAAPAHERQRLADGDLERHAVQRRLLGIGVGEAHVAELEAVAQARHGHGVGPIGDLAVRVQHVEDALGGRHGLLQAGVHAAQLLGRAVHQEKRRDEGHEVARVRRPEVISWLPYQSAATNATPPMSSISGGSTLSALVTFMLVR